MPTGQFERKLRTYECRYCGGSFESISTHANTCLEPECQKKKRRAHALADQLRKKKDYKKGVPVAKVKVIRYCQFESEMTGKKCGRKLNKNFFFCNEHLPQVEDI